MPSLGELFVEFGVVGDIKPLEKALKKIKETVSAIDEEIEANKTLLKYLKDLKSARNDSEKKLIKENFTRQIQQRQLQQEIKANEKAIAGKQEFAKGLASVAKRVALVAGATGTLITALKRISDSLIATNQVWINFDRQSNMSLQTLQKWGAIGAVLDKSLGMEGAAGAVANLEKRLFSLALTGEGATGFQLAGINPIGKSADQVLENLRNRISGLGDVQATYLLEQMGLDPRMLPLLRMSREEFAALNKELENYRLSDEQRKNIQDMNQQIQIANIKLKYMGERLKMTFILPVWRTILEVFTRFADVITKAVTGIADFISKSNALKAIILTIATIVGAFIAPVQTLITWIMLLIDDVHTFFKGGESFTGDVVNWVKKLGGGSITGDRRNYETPIMNRTSNINNTDNRAINQTISINTSQPVFDIQNQLRYAQYSMA